MIRINPNTILTHVEQSHATAISYAKLPPAAAAPVGLIPLVAFWTGANSKLQTSFGIVRTDGRSLNDRHRDHYCIDFEQKSISPWKQKHMTH